MTGEDTPKYRQIADDIRARIDAGEYPVGSRLPSKAELLKTYDVALGTLDKAINELRHRGYLETVQGVGMFAAEPPPSEADLAEKVDRLTARFEALEDRVRKIEADHDART